MKKYLALILLGLVANAQASVYQCEQDNKVIFSQFPCDDQQGAKPVAQSDKLTQAPINTNSDQQLLQLQKRNRFLEYQYAEAEQEYKIAVERIKTEMYNLTKTAPQPNETQVLRIKLQNLHKAWDERQVELKAELRVTRNQMSKLEQQYVQQQ